MAQTYTQIQRQIEALQKQAEKLKASEVAAVVERIKVAIEHYGLTSDQLFGSSSAGARNSTSSSAKATGKSSRTNGVCSTRYFVHSRPGSHISVPALLSSPGRNTCLRPTLFSLHRQDPS